mmetsp:Transcript_40202/g.90762  ORF Transcript_40202/g.90762 Transcript_40202/m.90762 type:complete len:366 (+) Transcript_40202:166-1263(+)
MPAVLEELVQNLWNGWPQPRTRSAGVWSWFLSLDVGLEHSLRVTAKLLDEGLLTSTHEPHDQCEGVNVDTVRVLLVANDFRGHVSPGADSAGHVGRRRLVDLGLWCHQFAYPEVGHLQGVAGIKEEVERLEVSVDDGLRAVVQEAESSGDRAGPPHECGHVGPEGVPKLPRLHRVEAVQITPLHELSDEERPRPVQACAQEHHEVRMPHRGEQLDLMVHLLPGHDIHRVLRTQAGDARGRGRRLRHDLRAPPVRDVNHALDGGAEHRAELDLACWDCPHAEGRRSLQLLKLCLVVSLASQQLREFHLPSPLCLQDGRHAKVVLLLHIGPQLHQQLHHFHASFGGGHVKCSASVVVGRVDVSPCIA